MSFTSPYRQHNYMGEFANGTAATAGVVALGWDSGGNPQIGMYYYDTTALDFKGWNGSAWSAPGAGGLDHNDLNNHDGGTTGEYYHLTSAEHTEITTFFANTDITGAQAETLSGGSSDASTLHHHDGRYFQETEFLATSAGAGDSGKPVKLDAGGHIDASMINDGDISHNSLDSPDGGTGGEYYHMTSAEHSEVTTFFANTDMTGAEAETLSGGSSDASTLHHHDGRYFQESEFLSSSAGAGDSGKPVKLDAAGHIDASMINDADIDHGTLTGRDDDDHTQYSLVAGTRPFTGTVGGVTPTASAHLATKGYVDLLFTNHKPKGGVLVMNMIDDGSSGPPGVPSNGDAYVVDVASGAWSGFSVGDIVVYDSTWKLVLAGSGGNPADGAKVVVTGYGSGTAANSFAGEGGNIGTYSSGWTFETIQDGWYVVVHGENEPNENTGYIVDSGSWVQWTGNAQSHNSLSGIDGGTGGEYYHLTNAQHTEITTFFSNTDMTGAEAETLSGGSSDASTLHHHDGRYFQESEFLATSAGAGDSGKPVKLDAGGHIDATMINDGDISHNSLDSPDGGTGGEYYHLTSAEHSEITTFFANTDITGAQAETLSGGSSDASSLHHHDGRYFQESEFLSSSAGAGDSGKPVKLDAAGHIDATMINDGDISHNSLDSPDGGTSGEYYHLTSAEHTEITTFFANTDITGAQAETLSGGSSDASTLHHHDGRYYTESEMGSTSAGSEGALLVGTDTKANLASATTVEAALTELNTRNSGANKSYAGNPNGNLAGSVGDLCRDTTNSILYWCQTGGDSATAVWFVS